MNPSSSSNAQCVTFQQFTVRDEALALADFLKLHDVEYKLETGLEDYNPAFVSDGACRILIQPEDMDKVSALFTANIDKDYYLYSFSDVELQEIIDKRDEWSHLDFILSKQILRARGITIDDVVIQQKEEQRISELSKPIKVHPFWLTAGYILAAAGGLLGIFLGWSILAGKKQLPNGEKVYNYSESDRKHAQLIVIIGAIMVTIAVLFNLLGLIDFVAK